MKHEMVSEDAIEVAWQKVTEAATQAKLSTLMEEFGESQPAMLDFLSEGSEHWSSDAADLVFFSVLVIWECFRDAKAVSATRLTKIYKSNSKWLEEQHGDSVILQKKLSEHSKYKEANLMRYVGEAVFEAHEDGLEVEPEEQEQLFLVLKTFVESLSDPA